MLLAGLIPATAQAVTATTARAAVTAIAAASGPIPSDCSLASINGQTMSLTCTDRPSSQEWNLITSCLGAPVFLVHGFGNHVTGDGTSTATCLSGTASLPTFNTYSS